MDNIHARGLTRRNDGSDDAENETDGDGDDGDGDEAADGDPHTA